MCGAALRKDWVQYNECAAALNQYGANIMLVTIPKPDQEQLQMGMFDKPVYLTGDEGFVSVGETFWLHNARVEVGGKYGEQAKLQVSHDQDGEKLIVYTSGKGVVNQVKRMDGADRARMPMELRLDQVPSKEGSPTNVLTPQDQDPPTGSTGNGENDF